MSTQFYKIKQGSCLLFARYNYFINKYMFTIAVAATTPESNFQIAETSGDLDKYNTPLELLSKSWP